MKTYTQIQFPAASRPLQPDQSRERIITQDGVAFPRAPICTHTNKHTHKCTRMHTQTHTRMHTHWEPLRPTACFGINWLLGDCRRWQTNSWKTRVFSLLLCVNGDMTCVWMEAATKQKTSQNKLESEWLWPWRINSVRTRKNATETFKFYASSCWIKRARLLHLLGSFYSVPVKRNNSAGSSLRWHCHVE